MNLSATTYTHGVSHLNTLIHRAKLENTSPTDLLNRLRSIDCPICQKIQQQLAKLIQLPDR